MVLSLTPPTLSLADSASRQVPPPSRSLFPVWIASGIFWIVGILFLCLYPLWEDFMRTVSAGRKIPPGYDDDAERRRISCEIISTLVAAGVSRDVIEYAISVTDCSLDVAEIETEIMLGEAIKAQSEIVDAQDAVEDTHAKLERTHTNLIRELERKKERLDRANAYYREWLQVADLKLELGRLHAGRR